MIVTFADRNNLGKLPVQEKLEWVTPKISLMGAGDTESKANNAPIEGPIFYAVTNVTGNGNAPS